MVKSLITALVTLGLFLGLCFIENAYINNTFNDFKKEAVTLYEKTEQQTATKQDVLDLQNLWIEKKKTFHIFIPHTEIKEIDLWVAESVTLIQNKKYEDALSKLDVVIELSEQIPKTFSFKIENIL